MDSQEQLNNERSPSTDVDVDNSSSIPEGWRRTKSGKRSKRNKLNPNLDEKIRIPKFIEPLSVRLLNFLGYSFLIFCLFDYIAVFIPLRLTDPYWEFQTFGQLVERLAIPLLGLLFVFYRQESVIPRIELNILRALSWLCLGMSIFYILLLPLGIVNTVRINNRNNAQITAQLAQQSQQINSNKEQLKKASEQDLNNLLKNLNRQGNLGVNSPQELRQLLNERTEGLEKASKLQAEALRSNQRTELFKNSVKWNLGTILAAVSFFWFWRSTSWIRSTALMQDKTGL